MFLNKKLLSTFSKFSKYRLDSRSNALPSFSGAKPVCYLKSPNGLLITSTDVNGFQETLSLCRKLPNIRTNGRSMTQFSDDKCWNCKQLLKVKEFACALCGALQYPKPNINFFQLLGVSQVYDVDLEELSKKFKRLQMIFHPDKFVNKSKEELDISEHYSRLLNKAYSTLKDPVGRGFYLLELRNISSEGYPLAQDFLMNVMEKNEELESINSSGALTTFMDKNNEEIFKNIKLISDAFQANSMDNARMNLLKLNYLMNLDTKIKEKQSDLNHKSD